MKDKYILTKTFHEVYGGWSFFRVLYKIMIPLLLLANTVLMNVPFLNIQTLQTDLQDIDNKEH